MAKVGDRTAAPVVTSRPSEAPQVAPQPAEQQKAADKPSIVDGFSSGAVPDLTGQAAKPGSAMTQGVAGQQGLNMLGLLGQKKAEAMTPEQMQQRIAAVLQGDEPTPARVFEYMEEVAQKAGVPLEQLAPLYIANLEAGADSYALWESMHFLGQDPKVKHIPLQRFAQARLELEQQERGHDAKGVSSEKSWEKRFDANHGLYATALVAGQRPELPYDKLLADYKQRLEAHQGDSKAAVREFKQEWASPEATLHALAEQAGVALPPNADQMVKQSYQQLLDADVDEENAFSEVLDHCGEDKKLGFEQLYPLYTSELERWGGGLYVRANFNRIARHAQEHPGVPLDALAEANARIMQAHDSKGVVTAYPEREAVRLFCQAVEARPDVEPRSFVDSYLQILDNTSIRGDDGRFIRHQEFKALDAFRELWNLD